MSEAEFPVYRFDLIAYNELEEEAYVNEDYYGPDPDWDQVRSDVLTMKRDYLQPFVVELEYFNKKLVYHQIAVTRKGQSTDSIYLKVIPKVDDGQVLDLNTARMLLAEMWGSDVARGMTTDDIIQDYAEEKARIIDWLSDIPTRFGFVVDPSRYARQMNRRRVR